ncbi:MAG: NAD-binding protein [Gammaproteobacteria bacterium]
MSTTYKPRKILEGLRLRRGQARGRILFTRSPLSVEATLLLRALVIAGLFAAVLGVLWWDHEGLTDHHDGVVSFTDVLYFTMVTITTVGYGDIVPVTDRARLIDAFFVSPVRIFVWFMFIGTAYQFLVKQAIEDFRMTRLQKHLTDHVILLGYGGSGSTAAAELVAQGTPADQIVVIDSDEQRVREAAALGFIGLSGDATQEELLGVAAAGRARAAIVAMGRDDTNVLAVLTLRSISRRIRIICAGSALENKKLLAAGGANIIVSPYQVGGFLLADAVANEDSVEILTDLLSCRGQLAMNTLAAGADEIGRPARQLADKLVVAIQRSGRRIPFWEQPDLVIQPGDLLVAIIHNSDSGRR